jgi:hypothetical protein
MIYHHHHHHHHPSAALLDSPALINGENSDQLGKKTGPVYKHNMTLKSNVLVSYLPGHLHL